MLQELVSYLVSIGQKTVAYAVHPHPTDKDKRLVIGPEGVTELATPRPKPVPLDTVATIRDLALRLHDRNDLEPTVWVDGRACTVTVASNDPFRRGGVMVSLDRHPLAILLEGWENGPAWFEHKDVVRLLRTCMADFIDPNVLPRFRILNWESVRKTRNALAQGQSSLDQAAQGRVTGADNAELMEHFQVRVPLFAEPDAASVTVFAATVFVELNTDTARIGFLLKPGTGAAMAGQRAAYLENAVEAALDTLDIDERFSVVHGETTHVPDAK